MAGKSACKSPLLNFYGAAWCFRMLFCFYQTFKKSFAIYFNLSVVVHLRSFMYRSGPQSDNWFCRTNFSRGCENIFVNVSYFYSRKYLVDSNYPYGLEFQYYMEYVSISSADRSIIILRQQVIIMVLFQKNRWWAINNSLKNCENLGL